MAKSKHGPTTDTKGNPMKYVVVYDVGSTGSRAHVFSYSTATASSSQVVLPHLVAFKDWSKKVKPGITIFNGFEKELGKEHLKKLNEFAESIVPPSLQSKTPLFIHATGGMRELALKDKKGAARLFDQVCKYQKSHSRLLLPTDCAEQIEIIDGSTEGIFGWIALNYLGDNLRSPLKHIHGDSAPAAAPSGAPKKGGTTPVIGYTGPDVPQGSDVPLDIGLLDAPQAAPADAPAGAPEGPGGVPDGSHPPPGADGVPGFEGAGGPPLPPPNWARSEPSSTHFTYGFMDLGGASAQLTFVPNATEIAQLESKQHDFLFKVSLPIPELEPSSMHEFNVFSRSFHGAGARLGYEAFDRALTAEKLTVDPCTPVGAKHVPPALSFSQKVKAKEFDDVDKVVKQLEEAAAAKAIPGNSSYQQCVDLIKPLYHDIASQSKKNAEIPQVDFNINHFVGVSGFWDNSNDIFSLGGKAFDYNTLKNKTAEFCSMTLEQIEANDYGKKKGIEKRCFESNWMLGVLEDLFKFPLQEDASQQSQQQQLDASGDSLDGYMNFLQSAETIDNSDFSWTYGRALLYAAQDMNPHANVGILGPNSKHYQYGKTKSGTQYTGGYHVFDEHNDDDDDDHDDDHDDHDDDDDDDHYGFGIIKEHPHRLWGGIVFLLVLFIAFYLLLGKAKRNIIWLSIRSKFRGFGGFSGDRRYRQMQSNSAEVNDEEYRLDTLADDDGGDEFDLSDEEPERR